MSGEKTEEMDVDMEPLKDPDDSQAPFAYVTKEIIIDDQIDDGSSDALEIGANFYLPESEIDKVVDKIKSIRDTAKLLVDNPNYRKLEKAKHIEDALKPGTSTSRPTNCSYHPFLETSRNNRFDDDYSRFLNALPYNKETIQRLEETSNEFRSIMQRNRNLMCTPSRILETNANNEQLCSTIEQAIEMNKSTRGKPGVVTLNQEISKRRIPTRDNVDWKKRRI